MATMLHSLRAVAWETEKRVSSAPIPDQLRSWRRRGAHRAELRRLLARADDYMLADVGLSRAHLAKEAGKPFWQK